MYKIMTWYFWMVTYLHKNVTIVHGASYHLLGSQIFWDLKIWLWLQVESYISDWQFSKSQHLASYVSRPNAMAYGRYLTFSWFSAKHEVMLQLTNLVVLNRIRFCIEPFAYGFCCTWPRQVLDRIFCYQSLTVLNHIRFWIELLLSESCLTQQHQVLSKPLAIGVV